MVLDAKPWSRLQAGEPANIPATPPTSVGKESGSSHDVVSLSILEVISLPIWLAIAGSERELLELSAN